MSTPVPSGAAAMLTLRFLVGSLVSSAFFIVLAMWFVLGAEDDAFDVSILMAAPLLLGLAAHGVCEAVGYRLPATAPGTPRQQAEVQSREQFQARLLLRFALCEAVVIVSLAASFVVTSGGFAVFLVGAAVGIALIAWHCWPGERTLRRSQESLEREGGTSYLREAYGLPPARGGAIKEL